jgi:hypothetical protein
MRITEIVYEKRTDDIYFKVSLSLSEKDSDYTVFYLNNEIKNYKEIFCSKIEGGKLKKRFVLNNSFWHIGEDGDFVFEEYFDDNEVVDCLINKIITQQITTEDRCSEQFAYDFFRDFRSLENYWN